MRPALKVSTRARARSVLRMVEALGVPRALGVMAIRSGESGLRLALRALSTTALRMRKVKQPEGAGPWPALLMRLQR